MDKLQKGVQMAKSSGFNSIVKFINTSKRDNLHPHAIFYGVEKIVTQALEEVERVKEKYEVKA